MIVDGVGSPPSRLANFVFQGTVLGPPLWNCYYEDARRAVNDNGFRECVFADDLNCFKRFARPVGDDMVFAELRACQASLHCWGNANQVLFDAAKESFHILHRSRPAGSSFKILGVNFDTKLLMETAASEMAAQAHHRLNTLLRAKRFYPPKQLIWLYKSLVLSYIETSTPAIFHATSFALSL